MSTITPLPAPPTRTDPTNFAARADAFLAALPQMVDEFNAAAFGTAAEFASDAARADSAELGSGLFGHGAVAYGTNTAGGAIFVTVWGDGATDRSTTLAAANSLGYPIRIKGVLVIGTPTTITVPIIDTIAQIFSTASQVTIDNGLPVRPEWFGLSAAGAGDRAVAALPSTGGVVLFANKTYLKPFVHAYNGAYLAKSDVKLVGAKMPRIASDCRSLAAGSGTILQGMLLAYASGFEASNLGVDCGKTYCDANNGGTALDALVLTYASDAQKAANALRVEARLHNVVGLCYGPNSPVHGVIAGEGYSGVSCTGEVVACYGLHGVVIKCASVKAKQLTAYLNGTEGLIIKTDAQTTAVSTSVQIDRVVTLAGGPPGSSPYATPTTTAGSSNFGVLLHCFAGHVSKVQIGSVIEYGHAVGLKTQFDGSYILDSVKIGSIITDTNADAGVYFNAPAGATFQRVQVGAMECRNTPAGLVTVWTTASTLKIETLHAVNCTVAAFASSASATPQIDTVVAENCAAAFQLTSSTKPFIGKTLLTGTTTVYYQSSGSGLVPALSNSWAQVGGGDTFNVIPCGYGIELNGLISGGASTTVMTLPAFARPPSEKRLVVQGRDSGTGQHAVPVVITTSGAVVINDATGSLTNVANYLSLAGIRFSLTN
jgi:hypothetical protein